MRRLGIILALSTLFLVSICSAQETSTTAVPNLIRYGGTLKDTTGAAITANTGVTSAIHKQQDGGAPVWMETQSGASATTHESVLHAFNPNPDGLQPAAGLITDAAGNLYGTTEYGGAYNAGTVFELKLRSGGGGWTGQVLYSFNNDGTDGTYPIAELIFDRAGNLYGTTSYGGTYGNGTVFELSPNGSGGWTEQVVHSFCAQTNCPDGAVLYDPLIFDSAGNLYGTTDAGGTYNYGTVFELSPNGSGGWTELVLHSFNGTDGKNPDTGLIIDAAGNLYGTTDVGSTYGYGTVFELTPNGSGGWTELVLHSFYHNGIDGLHPGCGLIMDAAGSLYGTTHEGGTHGFGTVFEMTPSEGGGWTEQVLYSFKGHGTDGGTPYASLIFDRSGNLYGTTYGAGTHYDGTVFELSPNGSGGWTEQVLHSFNRNGTDGAYPQASLILDAAGNLYGTTPAGGAYYSSGTVFELTPSGGGGWTEQVLHNFSLKGTDGGFSNAGLIMDAAGNFYGTTSEGGAAGRGTVFELIPNGSGGWTERVLHSFCAQANCADGAVLYDRLIFDSAGNLYGTTHEGGTHGYGTVFELKPRSGGGWTEQVLHSFNGTDGAYPYAGLIFDSAGNLYGTTNEGGPQGYGTVFELSPNGSGGWTEQVLHGFVCTSGSVCPDGTNPYAGLILDGLGNLYGTTVSGGYPDQGTVFELSPNGSGGWTHQVLYTFCAQWFFCIDGANPYAGLIFDSAGNLYGTTASGGVDLWDNGTVFELTPQRWGWTEQVLYSFCTQMYCQDGEIPYAGLIFDSAGNLYGTTNGGGPQGYGTVFELSPSGSRGWWTEQVLHSFNGSDGGFPHAGLVFDRAGNLYGTTYVGGTYTYGTVFVITP